MPDHYSGPYPRPVQVVASAPGHRVSEEDRQAVIEQLRLNTAAGRLEIDEFGERVAQALVARTGAELNQLLADVPYMPTPAALLNRRQRIVVLIGSAYVGGLVLAILTWAATDMASLALGLMVAWSLLIICALMMVAAAPPGDGR